MNTVERLKTPVGTRGLLSEADTAAYLGMSRSFLRQARMKSKLGGPHESPPYVKIGRSVRYCHSDLDEWLRGLKREASRKGSKASGIPDQQRAGDRYGIKP